MAVPGVCRRRIGYCWWPCTTARTSPCGSSPRSSGSPRPPSAASSSACVHWRRWSRRRGPSRTSNVCGSWTASFRSATDRSAPRPATTASRRTCRPSSTPTPVWSWHRCGRHQATGPKPTTGGSRTCRPRRQERRSSRPGRPLLRGQEEDDAEHRRVRARVEHTLARMKNWKILRDYRQRGDGLHHAVQAVATMHNLALPGETAGPDTPATCPHQAFCNTLQSVAIRSRVRQRGRRGGDPSVCPPGRRPDQERRHAIAPSVRRVEHPAREPSG